MKKRVLIALVAVLTLTATAAAVWANGGGLVSYWPFDEGSGSTTANDAVNGNHGTIYGATYTTDKAPVIGNDYALAFDGNDYVQVANSSTLESSAVTVAAWVKSSSPGTYGYILAKGASGCTAASYALYTGGPGGLYFYIFNGSSYVRSPNGGSLAWDGQWHHVAGTYDGSVVRLYVDGDDIDSGTATTTGIGYSLPTTNDFFVGAYRGSCNLHFNGLIDEVHVWNRALSADEVAALSVGVGSVVWLPPIVLDDWTLNENATLPIKFQLYGVYGNLLCNDLMPTLQVNGETLDLRFDSTECYYISNFRPTSSGPHTAFISLDSVQLGSQGFEVVEPGKANGRGRGNN